MTGVLASYMRRRIATQTFGLLLFITGLMQVMELMEVTPDILDRNLGFMGVLRYAMLRTPGEIVMALPLSILLGAMTAFHAMARSREITAIRCAGVSLKRLLVILLPLPLVIALAQFALTQAVVPLTENALKAWWDSTTPPEDVPATWVHTSGGPVSFERNSPDGRRLEGLHLYARGSDGLFKARVMAKSATWEQDAWRLDEVTELSDLPARAGEASRTWETNLRPDDVTRLDVAQPHLSSFMLVDVIGGERVGSQPLSYYRTVLFRIFTAPLAAFVMLLLAVPPAGITARDGGGGGLLVALGLGLGFLLCDGLLSALGTGGRMPPLMAALLAPLVFAGIGFAQLKVCDRT